MLPDPDWARQPKLCVLRLENVSDESSVMLGFFFLFSLELGAIANVNTQKVKK